MPGGESVNRTVTTSSDGSYRIANLQAGDYVVRQDQPAIVIDGIDSHNGTESPMNDAFNLSLSSGEDVTGLNFGERGLQPAYIGNIFFLGNRLDQGAGVAVRADGSTSWYCSDGGWAGLRSLQATVSGDERAVTLTAVDNLGQTVQGTFSVGSSNVQLLGNSSDGYLVRFLGASSSFPLTPVVAAAAADAIFGE